MSEKTVITCDHCGVTVENTTKSRFTVMPVNAAYDMPTVDGCSKEHLGIALAKMFGIGVNGEADELLNRKQRELTKLTDANSFLITERDNMRARLAELEARMPANEVTNAERVQYETTIELQRKRIAALTMLRRVRDRVSNEIHYEHKCLILDIVDDELAKLEAKPAGKAPECFLCGKGPHDHTMMVLESLPEQFEVKWCNGRRQNFGTEKPAWWDVPKSDHVHELGSCSFCDKSPPDTSMESGLPDPVLASITLPTKPTKPLRERLEELASYWEKGAASGSMSEGYRQASKDCAKELREVINDSR